MRLKRVPLLVLLMVASLFLATSCGGSGEAGDDQQAAGGEPEATVDAGGAVDLAGSRIRLGFTSTGFDDLPIWPAIAKLEEQGIEVERAEFAEQEQTVTEMDRGNLDVTINLATPTVIAGVNQGAGVKVIAGYTKNRWVLVATPEIQELADLAGKRIGVHSETSFTKAVADYYIEQNDIEGAELAIVPGSDVRAQSLARGQLDATVIGLEDFLTLEEQFPGRAHVLANFAEDYPDLMAFTTTASEQWVDENPELAQAFVAALLEGFRAVSESEAALETAREQYADFAPSESILEAQVGALVEGGYFPDDGQLTPEICRDSVAFMISVGQAEGDASSVDDSQYCRYDVIEAARESAG